MVFPDFPNKKIHLFPIKSFKIWLYHSYIIDFSFFKYGIIVTFHYIFSLIILMISLTDSSRFMPVVSSSTLSSAGFNGAISLWESL